MRKYTAPTAIAAALLLAVIASKINIEETSIVSMILSPNAESMKVDLLVSSNSSTLSSSAVIIVSTNEKHFKLSRSFYYSIHEIVKRAGLNVSMDYFTLREKIREEISRSLINYTKTYFPYCIIYSP
jgi:hypothetical protein